MTDPTPPMEAPDAPIAQAFNINLSMQHLQTYLAVVDSRGRFSAAASQIGMSQPGITHQINELERRLNVTLLDRARGRAARITPAGRLVERYARGMVQMQHSLLNDLDDMRQTLGGHLRVGSSPGPGEHWLPPLLCEFRQTHRRVEVELHLADARSIVDAVFGNELELGFVGGKWSRSGLQFDPVYTDELVMIASPDNPLAQQEGLDLLAVTRADFIAQEPGSGQRVTLDHELSERGVQISSLNIIAELGNQESVKAAVAAGYGIGCVWRGSVASELALGSLVVLDIPDFQPDNNFYAVRRSSRALSRNARTFLSLVRRTHRGREQRAEHGDGEGGIQRAEPE